MPGENQEQGARLDNLEQQNIKLLGSVDALKKELTQHLESLEAKDDLVHMLQEKISKQSLEISCKDKHIMELKNQSSSPKAKLSQQFSQLKNNIFKKKGGGGGGEQTPTPKNPNSHS